MNPSRKSVWLFLETGVLSTGQIIVVCLRPSLMFNFTGLELEKCCLIGMGEIHKSMRDLTEIVCQESFIQIFIND